jgi:LysR family transcriptional regulator, glycine cleavage system transcriptional activator
MTLPKRRSTRRRNATPPSQLRRLPLGSLRVFVAVAEQLSFTRAAAALGVSVSAASMQVQALEQHLGLPLFRRDGRGVELTAEGVQLLPRVRDGLSQLQAAIDETRQVRATGSLRISTLHSFLLQWLLPRLPDFETRHPRISLLVETSNTPVDLNRSNVQVAIRFAARSSPQLHSEKVLDEWLVPVCSPALLAKLGPVSSPEDLGRYRLLHSSDEPWDCWHSGAGTDRWPDSGFACDDSVAAVRAAEAGRGMALARWSLVAAEVQSGRLAIASPVITPYERCYYFVCLPRLRSLAKLVSFRDWLMAQAEAFPRPEQCLALTRPGDRQPTTLQVN